MSAEEASCADINRVKIMKYEEKKFLKINLKPLPTQARAQLKTPLKKSNHARSDHSGHWLTNDQYLLSLRYYRSRKTLAREYYLGNIKNFIKILVYFFHQIK
jgi:hypothetical protein